MKLLLVLRSWHELMHDNQADAVPLGVKLTDNGIANALSAKLASSIDWDIFLQNIKINS